MVEFTRKFTTKSGIPITIGAGSGTKWQWFKKNQNQGNLTQELIDQLVLALKVGFNHIDTAEYYTTHEEVAAAIKQSGKKREDLFLTTKYSPGYLGTLCITSGPLESIDKALKEFDTDYIDLFLIHSPFFDETCLRGLTLLDAWKQMLEVKKSGKVRHIGVLNFAIPHLEEIMAIDPSVVPEVNQIEVHAQLQEQTPGILDFCRQHQIQVEAYGPLLPLFRSEQSPIIPEVEKLAQKYQKTQAQILLRWVYQQGILPITTLTNEQRLRDALDIVNFELEQKDLDALTQLGLVHRQRNFFADDMAKVEKQLTVPAAVAI